MARVLIAFTVVLIALLSAAFIAPAVIDWNAYRASIEEAASELVHRSVRIEGDISIAILPEPHLKFANVNIADNTYRTHIPQATVDQVEIAVSLQELFNGRIEARHVRLEKPEVLVSLTGAEAAGSGSEIPGLLLPATVNTLEIRNGTAAFFADARSGAARLKLDKINGKVTGADAGNTLRFAGSAWRDGKPYEIKLTGSGAASKAIRMIGTVTDPGTKNSLHAEGSLSLADSPTFSGTATFTAPLSPSPPPADHAGARQAEAPSDSLFLKASVGANLDRVELSDLIVTLDMKNRPQILTGSALLSLPTNRAEVSLAAKSFDADLVLTGRAAGEPESQNGGTAAPMFGEVADWDGFTKSAAPVLWFLPEAGLRLSLSADQLQWRGELLDGFAIEAERVPDRWTVQKFTVALPGETSLKAQGTFRKSSDAGAMTVSGIVDVSGRNLARLARWARPDLQGPANVPSRPFAVKGSVIYSGEGLSIQGVSGSIAGTPLEANVSYLKTPLPRLALSLSSEKIDLADFGVQGFAPNEVAGFARSNVLPALNAVLENASEASLDLSVHSVKSGGFEAKNLTAKLALTASEVNVSKLNLETSNGLIVRGEGRFPLKTATQGKFEGQIEARSAEALNFALSSAGIEVSETMGEWLEKLAPTSLAGTVASSPEEGVAIQATGALAGTKLDGHAKLLGGVENWRHKPLDIAIGASASDGAKLYGQLAYVAPPEPQTSGAAAPGKASFRLSGPPEKLDATFSFKGDQLDAQFKGTADLMGEEPEFFGVATIASGAANRYLPAKLSALLGWDGPGTLNLDTVLRLRPGYLEANKLDAKTARGALSGDITYNSSAKSERLSVYLSADDISLSTLGAPLLAAPLPSTRMLSADPQAFWPDQPFAVSLLESASAKLALKAKRLKISDTLSLQDGQLSARIENGELKVETLEGRLLGGDFQAKGRLRANGSLVAADGAISVQKGDMAAFPQKVSPAIAGGKVSLDLRLAGQGLSPSGLVSTLGGKGRLVLSDGHIGRLSPLAVQKVGDELHASSTQITETAVIKALTQALKAKDFKYRHLKAGLTVRDGLIELPRASLRGKEGVVRLQAYLDISKLQVDATWQLGVRSDKRARWPGVKIVSAGPLSDLGGLPTQISAEDFTRALIVKKMEQDIHRLETLGKPQQTPTWTTKQEDAVSTLPDRFAPSDFETRMRDALRKQNAPAPQGP